MPVAFQSRGVTDPQGDRGDRRKATVGEVRNREHLRGKCGAYCAEGDIVLCRYVSVRALFILNNIMERLL